MLSAIVESDWKRFRNLREIALNRYCQRTLDAASECVGDVERTPHDRYLELQDLLHRRRKIIAMAFDDSRRSNAIIQLASMRHLRIVTDNEFKLFSEPTRQAVENVLSVSDGPTEATGE